MKETLKSSKPLPKEHNPKKLRRVTYPMNTRIQSYDKTTINSVGNFLLEYRDCRGYEYLFSSKEWICSFIDVYAPRKNFLIRSEKKHNYFSLSTSADVILFTGDPFNDFNGVYVRDLDDCYEFSDIFAYLNHEYPLSLSLLFEEPLLKSLKTFTGGEINKESETYLKIVVNEGVQSDDGFISEKIRKMYQKFSDRFSFFRAFGDKMHDEPGLLEFLLSRRRQKLLAQKNDEYNQSFEPAFNAFIKKLCGNVSLWNHIFLDYCIDKETSEIASMSLNFIKDRATICYLRAHIPSSNEISFGLILDFWSIENSIQSGITTIDFTRGTEPYKYRLGAKEYYLSGFKMQNEPPV